MVDPTRLRYATCQTRYNGVAVILNETNEEHPIRIPPAFAQAVLHGARFAPSACLSWPLSEKPRGA